MRGMTKVNSWIRCEATNDGACYTIDRDGDPEQVIDMAVSVLDGELWDNMQLYRYARMRTRQMFRDLWRQSDKHEKLMLVLEKAARYATGCLAILGGIVAVGWCVTALERLVFG